MPNAHFQWQGHLPWLVPMAAAAGSVQETSTRSGLENALWDLKGGQYSTAATPASLPTPPETFVLFLANLDPETGESWCPGVALYLSLCQRTSGVPCVTATAVLYLIRCCPHCASFCGPVSALRPREGGPRTVHPCHCDAGSSVCADCREALPVITAAWERVQEKHRAAAKEGEPAPVLVKAWVGDRPTWKGPNNPFKILPFCVTSVPTLLKWDYGDLSKGINLGKALPGRLGDEECKDGALVAKLFGLA